ncbi:Receptor-like protein EIX2 [Linum perenne]
MAISAVFLLVWLIWVCFFCYGTHGASCNQAEREALLNFKADLQDPSSRLSSWVNGSEDCCEWHGVVCDEIIGHVTELHLQCPDFCYEGARLEGKLNPSLLELKHLRNSPFKGKISPSLLGLKNLSYLDLSNNDFQGNLIPGFLGSVSSLKSLFLLRSGFGGVIPHQLGNLSNLQELSLQAGDRYVLSADSLQWLSADGLQWLSGLSSLEYLDLTNVDLSNVSDWLNMINTVPSLTQLYLPRCRISHNPPLVHVNLSSLSVLDLGFNEFEGRIPDQLQNLTSSLTALKLSYNKFNGSIPGWLFSFRHLTDLYLRSNELVGRLSNDIGNSTSLANLDLSLNTGLEGGVPVSFKSLCHLSSLNLINMKLQQNISEMLQILGECPASTLQTLYLDDCQLFGQFPDDIGKFKSLNLISLQNNSISGGIPVSFKSLCHLNSLSLSYIKLGQSVSEVLEILGECPASTLETLSMVNCRLFGPLPFSFGELTSLNYANFANNQINGTIPTSFAKLAELHYIDISQNSMEGVISPEIHFANLTKLTSFCASGNKMVLEVGPDSVFPKLFEIINLNSWYIGPGFPKWLQSSPELKSLDLSNTGISEPIPDWFWGSLSKFYYLNFSHNQIPGRLPNYMAGISFDSMYDFSWNNLEGPLPVISSNFTAFDLSNNFLSGNLLKFLCFNPAQMRDTEFLNLQGNRLSGEIPDCWSSWGSLKVIRLGNNELRGNIAKSIGTLKNLLSLRVQNNSLTGEIPLSLGNCSNLISVDLGDNRFEGNIPKWIGEKLSRLAIINLRGNKFQGGIPEELCHLQLLQILDLSHNLLSGNLPECVDNITAMANSRYIDEGAIYIFSGVAESFMEYQVLVAQGQAKTYSTILNYVRSLDLSSNFFSGQIPEQITRLVALKYINLSRNSLSGAIPGNLAAMASLESLDFSENKLSGVIPPGMTSMTFLNHLNLSYNNLSGRIPLSTQLQSFDPSSFINNKGLCGSPLNVNCSSADKFVPVEGIEDSNSDWFSVSVVLGYVVGFCGIVVPVAVHQQWIKWKKKKNSITC